MWWPGTSATVSSSSLPQVLRCPCGDRHTFFPLNEDFSHRKGDHRFLGTSTRNAIECQSPEAGSRSLHHRLQELPPALPCVPLHWNGHCQHS